MEESLKKRKLTPAGRSSNQLKWQSQPLWPSNLFCFLSPGLWERQYSQEKRLGATSKGTLILTRGRQSEVNPHWFEFFTIVIGSVSQKTYLVILIAVVLPWRKGRAHPARFRKGHLPSSLTRVTKVSSLQHVADWRYVFCYQNIVAQMHINMFQRVIQLTLCINMTMACHSPWACKESNLATEQHSD